MEKSIVLENLNFGYDKKILNNINLEITRGEFIGIVGPNGAGKSTLLKIIIGQLKPNSGRVKILENNGKDKSIGYLKQMNIEVGVSFPITPLEIVMLNLYNQMGLMKVPNKKIKNMALNALSMVNLQEKAYYNYNNMSGGEQQRVLIAKELVKNSNILIFDEPTAGIDQDSKELLFNILDHLNKKHNITIIIVTHELEFSKKYFNRILKLENGELKDYSEVNIW
ncbi:metal ABC transporter ATP-binding protein [Miniphocaeibacter halophilus]|uniref:ATP-binding cassette domain-containing protein n=1 Tax=Miniphocaeibacter halophilus TaxID=2931922 RepID=A0AC61MQW1_9FIRM|nr:ATP-binding cassette domain-containing protein [Miniphocaeibacter halophilus]QQK07972.1 ATP-binding cassette domain-containing protein [Miniphocaeibacter halophilus]